MFKYNFSPNQPEYTQLSNTCAFAEYGICSVYKGANLTTGGDFVNTFYPSESFLTFKICYIQYRIFNTMVFVN